MQNQRNFMDFTKHLLSAVQELYRSNMMT